MYVQQSPRSDVRKKQTEWAEYCYFFFETQYIAYCIALSVHDASHKNAFFGVFLDA